LKKKNGNTKKKAKEHTNRKKYGPKETKKKNGRKFGT